MKIKKGDIVVSIRHEDITNPWHLNYIGQKCVVEKIVGEIITTKYEDETRLHWREYMLKKFYDQREEMLDLEKEL